MHIDYFLRFLWSTKGLSQNTISAYQSDIEGFAQWCQSRYNKTNPLSLVQSRDVAVYLGQYAPATQARKLASLQCYYRWLVRGQHLSHNPLKAVKPPRLVAPATLTLSEREANHVVSSAQNDSNHDTTVKQLRDAMLLELLYSCGLRVSEVATLRKDQFSLSAGMVRVSGKGGADRAVPLGEEAMAVLGQYLSSIKKDRVYSPFLFPGKKPSRPLTRQSVWHIVKRYSRTLPSKTCSPHTFRHAYATHMLNNGADIRSLQMMLGHASVATTQRYLHLARGQLADFHQCHHPRG